jgi:hypothetical protein
VFADFDWDEGVQTWEDLLILTIAHLG